MHLDRPWTCSQALKKPTLTDLNDVYTGGRSDKKTYKSFKHHYFKTILIDLTDPLSNQRVIE